MTSSELVDEILALRRDRVVLVGGPLTGKSTLARALAPRYLPEPEHQTRCTDELMGVLEWSEASAEVARWLNEPGPWIIEGVATARALRKWLTQHPGERFEVTVAP